MSVKFDVFRDRIINADVEEVKDLIKQFRRSRQNGDISEEEESNLKDIANRKLESGDEGSPS